MESNHFDSLYILEKIKEYSTFSKGHIRIILQFLSIANIKTLEIGIFNNLYGKYYSLESEIKDIIISKKCDDPDYYIGNFLSLTLYFIEFLSDLLEKELYIRLKNTIVNVILEEKYYLERVYESDVKINLKS